MTEMKQTDSKPEPYSMGIVINFTASTVAGFRFPIKIETVDEDECCLQQVFGRAFSS